MYIKNVKLTNFRNYKTASAEFFHGVNLITGQNGQGKTNLAESLVVASHTKSPRTSKHKDMILWGEEKSIVELIVNRNFGDVKISYELGQEENKKFFINDSPVNKLSEVFGNLVIVYFSPTEMKIIAGGPQERRDFMDTDISELSGQYYNLVQRYTKVLDQRNKLLKNRFDRKMVLDQIDVFSEQLASLAAPIIKTRRNFIKKIAPLAHDVMIELSGGKEDLKIEYFGIGGETTAEIKTNLLRAYQVNLEKDLELGYTLVGPHRDDVKILINDVEAKDFASQGQQRSIVLALKMAEMEIFEKELGEKPVLILDDVFSELDNKRQKMLYKLMENTQVIVTGTAVKFKPEGEYVIKKIKNATITHMQKMISAGLNDKSSIVPKASLRWLNIDHSKKVPFESNKYTKPIFIPA